MAKLTKAQIAEKEEAIKTLQSILIPGQKVYTNLLHVSKSGMSREISLHIIATAEHDKESYIRDITYLAAKAMGEKVGDKDGIKIGGCGMDMGFSLVYSLGRYLFPEGFATKHGRNGDTSGWDNDGGYALKHVWL